MRKQKRNNKNRNKNANIHHKVKKMKNAAIFDEKERDDYLQGFYGSKNKRREEYFKKVDAREKQELKDEKRKQIKEKKKRVQRLQEIIDQNRKELQPLSVVEKADKTQNVKTLDNKNVKITTSFLS